MGGAPALHAAWARPLAHSQEMLANPHYGRIGLLAMPYFVMFECLAPIMEVAGFVILPFAWAIGLLEQAPFLLFLASAVGYGLCLSFMTLILEECSFRRYVARASCCAWQPWRCWRTSACVSWRAGGGWWRSSPVAVAPRPGTAHAERRFRRRRPAVSAG